MKLINNKFILLGIPAVVMSFWLLGDVIVSLASLPAFAPIYISIWFLIILFYFPIVTPLYFLKRSHQTQFKKRLLEIFLKSLSVMHIVFYGVLLLAYVECFSGIYCNDSEPISSYGLLLFVWLGNLVTTTLGSVIVTSIHHLLTRNKS